MVPRGTPGHSRGTPKYTEVGPGQSLPVGALSASAVPQVSVQLAS